MVNTHTQTMSRDVSSTQKVFHYFLILPRMHHEHTWMNWFHSFGDNVTTYTRHKTQDAARRDL